MSAFERRCCYAQLSWGSESLCSSLCRLLQRAKGTGGIQRCNSLQMTGDEQNGPQHLCGLSWLNVNVQCLLVLFSYKLNMVHLVRTIGPQKQNQVTPTASSRDTRGINSSSARSITGFHANVRAGLCPCNS